MNPQYMPQQQPPQPHFEMSQNYGGFPPPGNQRPAPPQNGFSGAQASPMHQPNLPPMAQKMAGQNFAQQMPNQMNQRPPMAPQNQGPPMASQNQGPFQNQMSGAPPMQMNPQRGPPSQNQMPPLNSGQGPQMNSPNQMPNLNSGPPMSQPQNSGAPSNQPQNSISNLGPGPNSQMGPPSQNQMLNSGPPLNHGPPSQMAPMNQRPQNQMPPSGPPQMAPMNQGPALNQGPQNPMTPGPPSQITNQQNQMPPSGPPSQMAPMSQGRQMPPSGPPSQMSPMNQGPQMPPMNQGAQNPMPPGPPSQIASNQGQQMPPSGPPSQMAPMSQGKQMPPSGPPSQMAPMNQGPQSQMPPMNQGPQNPMPPGPPSQIASNQGPQMPPSGPPSQMAPQGQQMPPSGPPSQMAQGPQSQMAPLNQGPQNSMPPGPPSQMARQSGPPSNQGPPLQNQIPSSQNHMFSSQNQNRMGQPTNQMPPGPNQMMQGPNQMTQGPNQMTQGPNQMTQGPNQMTQGPNQMTQGPNQMTQGPNQMMQGPNQMMQGPNQMPPRPNMFPGQNPMPQMGQTKPSMAPPQGNRMPQMPMPSAPQRPGFPSQGTNQLSNQMSNMNLNSANMPPQSMPRPNQGYPLMNGGPGMINGNPQMTHPPYPGSPPGYQQQGYPQTQSQYPHQPNYPQEQHPPQQKSLNPELMPSPMQVMEEDQQLKSGIFYTNQKGQLPPLVTTDFIVQDQGNSSPRFVRSTLYTVPISADLLKQTAVPFALILSPMAEVMEEENPPPLVDFGEIGPVRCVRCKAYMCPNMQFYDGGRRFHCLLCTASTEVPAEYFQHLDQTGLRVDRFDRPELVLGTYDIIATKEYCRENQFPKPPALIFLIDVSYNNVKSGLVSLLCGNMKTFLQSLPKERNQEKSSMKVGFITYNSSVHFYNLNPSLGQPQMLMVGDTQDMFMPLLDGFLADAQESETLIDTLMDQIPTMFAETRETETILEPAIKAGLEALKASNCAGKLLVFHSSLPTCEAPGKLKNRDDRKLLGTDKEKTVLTPQNTVYNNLGQECVAAGCSVDIFALNNSYIDLATIGQVSRLTGGEVYKYTYFQAEIDGERLVSDVEKNIKRLCGFDAIMRVRTSTGIRPTDFYGHFFMSNTTDIELASIDPDKAVAIEIKHDDKLSEESTVYIQAALLYTSLSGQRRIRIINLALKSCSLMADIYRDCELDTIMNFFSKQSVVKILDSTPKAIKDTLISTSAQILACYRKNCALPSSAGQLILPECLKLLPVYMNSLIKSDPLSGGSDMTVDDRWFTMAAVLTMDIPSSLLYIYPRFLPLHELADDDFPLGIRCSADNMADNGVYLLENGIYMFLWLGLSVPSEWVMSVFGVPSTAQVDTDKNRLPVLNNRVSERIRNIIETINSSRHRTMRLTLVRQKDKMEFVMKHFLVEDKGLDNSPSYVDFLCHLHKEIRSQIS